MKQDRSSTGNSNYFSNSDNELTLEDIVVFIKNYWKTIIGCTFIGIISGTIFYLFAPKQYEAIAKIKMAQIKQITTTQFTQNNTLNNIEDPQSLVQRMNTITSYSNEAISKCGLEHVFDIQRSFNKNINFDIPKAQNNIVVLTVRNTTKNSTLECIKEIVKIIRADQAQLVKEHYDNEIIILDSFKGFIKGLRMEFLSDDAINQVNDKTKTINSDLIYLLNYLGEKKSVIQNNANLESKLIAPIYLKEKAIFPDLTISLLLGGVFGVLVGTLFSLFRNLSQFKSNS